MKIITDIQKPDKEKEVREIPKSKTLIDQTKLRKGQFVWKFNMKTKEFKKVTEFTDVTVKLNGSVHKKLLKEKDCLYVVAINKENAAKKIIKLLDVLEILNQ